MPKPAPKPAPKPHRRRGCLGCGCSVLGCLGAVILLFTALSALAAFWLVQPMTPDYPITWRVGEIDPRFGVDAATVERAARSAEAIWESGTGRNLLAQTSDGEVIIRLVYDERQAALLAIRGESDRIDSQSETLDKQADDYKRLARSYEQSVTRYNQEVAAWNARGGAPRSVARRLESQRRSLDATASKLRSRAKQVNASQDKLNQQVTAFNQKTRNFRWTAGLFHYGASDLDIYTFTSTSELEWELAHEFGHSLGIFQHVSDQDALMAAYASDAGEKRHTLDRADLAALNNVPALPRAYYVGQALLGWLDEQGWSVMP